MFALVPLAVLASLSIAAEPPPEALGCDPEQVTPGALSLSEAVRVARARHPRLRAAAASTSAAEAQAAVAMAPLLPQVSAAIGYQRMTGNVEPRPGVATSPNAPEASFDGFNRYSASVALTQLIWDFGQTTKRWEAAQANQAAATTAEATMALDVVAGVRLAYVTAWGSRALVRTTSERVAIEERHLKEAEAFVAAEARSPIEVVKGRALVANARAQRIAAEGAFESALEQLAQAMGVTALRVRELTEDAVAAVPGEGQPVDALLTRAVATRPELRTLADQQRAYYLTAEAARAGYWPTIGLTLGVTDAGTEFTNLGWNMSAGVSLSWSLYSGDSTANLARISEAQAAVVGANAEALRLAIRSELAAALVDIRSAKGQLDASQEALTSATEQLRLAEARYSAKVGDMIELEDAASAKNTAAEGVVTASFRLALARVRLLRALGESP